MADPPEPKDTSAANNSPPEKHSDSKAPTTRKTPFEIIEEASERQRKLDTQMAKIREDQERIERIERIQKQAMLPRPNQSKPDQGKPKPAPPVNIYDIYNAVGLFDKWIRDFTTPRPEQRQQIDTAKSVKDDASAGATTTSAPTEPDSSDIQRAADLVRSPRMVEFFDSVAKKSARLRSLAAGYRIAAGDVLAWCWDWNRFIASGFLLLGAIALQVSAYVIAEILFGIGIALFVVKGIHDLWAKQHRKEIAVILCVSGIVAIVGQAVLIEWNRPREAVVTAEKVLQTIESSKRTHIEFISAQIGLEETGPPEYHLIKARINVQNTGARQTFPLSKTDITMGLERDVLGPNEEDGVVNGTRMANHQMFINGRNYISAGYGWGIDYQCPARWIIDTSTDNVSVIPRPNVIYLIVKITQRDEYGEVKTQACRYYLAREGFKQAYMCFGHNY